MTIVTALTHPIIFMKNCKKHPKIQNKAEQTLVVMCLKKKKKEITVSSCMQIYKKERTLYSDFLCFDVVVLTTISLYPRTFARERMCLWFNFYTSIPYIIAKIVGSIKSFRCRWGLLRPSVSCAQYTHSWGRRPALDIKFSTLTWYVGKRIAGEYK